MKSLMIPKSLTLWLFLLGLVLLSTGCVTNGRRVLLKEYGPSIAVTDSNSLKGVTVCLKGFETAPDLVALKPASKPEKLEGFKYTHLTREQDKEWDREQRALQKAKRAGELKIGNMRNGWGMVMSHVYALNDPVDWMVQGLKYDLEAQGARVVDAAEAGAADVVVGGKIELLRADMYMTVNSAMLVDLAVQPKSGPPRQRQIHTHGATAAMLASEGEYFHALRDARQKFSILVAKEIQEARSK
jgi:hypothetical protein